MADEQEILRIQRESEEEQKRHQEEVRRLTEEFDKAYKKK